MFPFYEGSLAEDCRRGRGVYTFANGDSYSGEFKVRVCGESRPCVWRGGPVCLARRARCVPTPLAPLVRNAL